MLEKEVRNFFSVQEKKVGGNSPCFIIAEIGNNHNGSLELAKKLVYEAKESGADAVKFQMRDLQTLYGIDYEEKTSSVDLGAQYTLDLLVKYQLSHQELFEVFDYCKKLNIIAFCTPWDFRSVDLLENYGISLYKVASADLTNHPLIKKIAETGKPIICSSGMADEQEVMDVIALLKNLKASFAILHCNSTYPTPFKDVKLNYLEHLKTVAPIVGYSGHERNFHIPIAAVAMGAKIIEKHFTLDKTMMGVDHRVSLLPSEFKLMVEYIRDVEEALGDSIVKRVLTQGEMMNRENLGKSLVINRNLEKGSIIKSEMIDIISPGTGLPPYMVRYIEGTLAKRNLKKGDILFRSDLPQETKIHPRPYKFKRPWGIPVRYHDVHQFLSIANPSFVEFHLSYKDMEEPIQKYFNNINSKTGFTVHAPELFQDDHILDLCSLDLKYRKKSIENLQKVIEITVELKQFFPQTVRPMIIATIGGFTTDKALSFQERQNRYEILFEVMQNFKQLTEVEILPQSTAPFPWHMGGQQYQNLFLYPEEIVDFCVKNHSRICLDVSHSYLACNQLNICPEKFFTLVAPYSAHLHLGDSLGVDGEGLQIGEGQIDFNLLSSIFNKLCPLSSFIPEIWQGHKNEGEGFWIALNKLEELF